ncbi:hypothetical protein [Rhizobium leguminosarum]|uniref:hypothetical protein n=1 Tax=Rhizobium leguminosarum TaxID=384 RepID=UPI00103A034A|nr:hypothetical protein [Rhizobium leguminosarum]TBZ00234.1 hypothetical protein E0H49_15890 [Rhizobium leguminosarum bv. viciae]
MVKSILERRLFKLEGRNPARPYEHLTDEQLDARIADGTTGIEAATGMDLADYAEVLSEALRAGEPLPDGMTKMEIHGIIASFRDVVSTRSHHAQ